MPNPSTSELPKPRSWDEFEDIVWEIYTRRWKDSSAVRNSAIRNGRTGQQQYGVDIYGQPEGMNGSYVGIQCKRYSNQNLTETVLRTEVTEAENFEPSLSGYIIATTANRDSKLQLVIRKLNTMRQKGGKFPIDIVFWEDLSSELANPANRDLLRKYYGGWEEVFSNAGSKRAPYELELSKEINDTFLGHAINRPQKQLFIGRRPLVSKLRRQISTKKFRLVTLFSGVGGIGKTALAREIVSKVRVNDFANGILFVELDEAPNVEALLVTLSMSLDLPYTASVERIAKILVSRQMLLVLDNIDQIVANDPLQLQRLVKRLLQATSVSLLCTGREPIGLPEEKLVEILPLDPPESRQLLTTLIGMKTELLNADDHLIGELISICDGIPLAIELAVSWFPKYTLHEYINQFHKTSAKMLRNEKAGNGGDRLTNYEISVRITYDRLLPVTQEQLRKICLFPVPPLREMFVEDLAEIWSNTIQELRGWNLVSENTTLRVLVPIREIVRTFATGSEKINAAHTLANYYQNLSNKPGTEAFTKAIALQHTNITFAIRSLLAAKASIGFAQATRLTQLIETAYIQQGLFNESHEILTHMLEISSSMKQAVPCGIYKYYGNVLRHRNGYVEAIEAYSRALQCQPSTPFEQASAMYGLGNAQKNALQYIEAAASFNQALEIFRQDETRGIEQAQCLWGIANVRFATSAWTEALDLYKQSLAIFSRNGRNSESIEGMIACLKGICDVLIKKRDYHGAMASIYKAQSLFDEQSAISSDALTEAKIQQGIGDASKHAYLDPQIAGQPKIDYGLLAESAYLKAIKLYRDISTPIGEALSSYKLAEFYAITGKTHDAKDLFRKAESIFLSRADKLGTAKSQLALIKLQLTEGKATTELRRELEELATIMRRDCQSKYWEGEALLVLAVCSTQLEDLEAASLVAKEATLLFRVLDRPDKVDVAKRVLSSSYDLQIAFME